MVGSATAEQIPVGIRIILFPTFEACQQRNRDPSRGHVVAEDDLWENYDSLAWCVNNIKPDL
jgi:hypothetical protein